MSVKQPVVGRSSMNTNESPVKRNRPQSAVRQNMSMDDTLSANRSTTTTGGGLANKIGLAISRIISAKAACDTTDDDVADLISLLTELNEHQDLGVKLSSTSKIAKILQQDQKANVMDKIQQ